MRCPSCHTEIKDESPSFCPRCGTPFPASEAEATTELRPEDPSDDVPVTPTEVEAPVRTATSDEDPQTTTGTQRLDEGDAAPPPSGSGSPLVADLVRSLLSVFRREGLGDLLVAALFGFLVAVALGAVLVAAARMQYPFLGQGASSFSILSAVVMAGLGILGVPISIGDLSVSAVPIGALALVGASLVWATRRVVGRGPAVRVADAVLDGMKVGVPFAVLCWLAALVFRIGPGPTPAGADAGAALILALLWGALFGAIGGLLSVSSVSRHLGDLRSYIGARARPLLTGLSAGMLMLAVTGALSLLAGLAWIVAGLLGGGEGIGGGEVAAAVIYLLAFGPNVLVAIAAVAHGAPIEVGAQITAAGRQIGSVEQLSLFEWGGGSPPWFAFLLLAIPVMAGLLGGFYARRAAHRTDPEMHVLGAAACTYGIVIGLLASLAEARLGAGMIRERGFGMISPDAGMTLLLAVAWALVGGYAGWRLAESQRAAE